jgi:copper oxidase (laccase) domain-containing protein
MSLIQVHNNCVLTLTENLTGSKKENQSWEADSYLTTEDNFAFYRTRVMSTFLTKPIIVPCLI